MKPITVDDAVEMLINHYSISEILRSIIKVCEKANRNYPLWGWNHDKDAISSILPKIKN